MIRRTNKSVVILCLTSAILVFSICVVQGETTIEKLFTKIEELQESKDAKFSYFPPTWEKQKGSYLNNVKLNFHGSFDMYALREMFSIPDVNMFTPAWVTACLIEAYEFGKAPKPQTAQLELALHAMDHFRNKNAGYNNSEMTFWPQTMNETVKYFQSYPGNLMAFMKLPDYMPDKMIEEFLDLIGLKNIAKAMESLLKEKSAYVSAFHIPPDFDDTFVNIGIGSLLSQFQKDFPAEHALWDQQNSQLKSVFDKVKKYAYRPFSNVSRENNIDSRTYMYLRTFLDSAKTNQKDVALITTWLQDTEEVKTLLDKGVAMPFNVNNVDITVAANFIYGVVTCVGSGVCNPNLIDTNVQQVVMNSTALVAHEIATNLSSRPELALTYYPSKFEFYWFVTRSFAFLNRYLRELFTDTRLKGLMETLGYIYTRLWGVLKKEMTNDILSSLHTQQGESYIDDFLGNSDRNLLNQTVNHAEDRLFSTAVSVNALINTWTVLDNETLKWGSDTPNSVKQAVLQMVTFLDKSILSGQYKPLNTFFSGSGKGKDSMPFFYPANRMEYFNGTTFTDKDFPNNLHYFDNMQGYVDPDTYAAMLKQPHFGVLTPTTFHGYNNDVDGFFPFWTCDAYTYAVTLVALSHYENIAQ